MRETPALGRQAPARGPSRRPPVRHSHALAEEICARTAHGESWAAMCGKDGLPAYKTLYLWLDRYPQFADAYAIARQRAAESFADRALSVAENATAATVQRDRLLVGTLRWRASVAAPHLFGLKTPPAGGQPPRKVIFEVRRFERVVGPDGVAYARELPRVRRKDR